MCQSISLPYATVRCVAEANTASTVYFNHGHTVLSINDYTPTDLRERNHKHAQGSILII